MLQLKTKNGVDEKKLAIDRVERASTGGGGAGSLILIAPPPGQRRVLHITLVVG